MANLKSPVVRACWTVVAVVSAVRLGIAMVRFLQVDELQILHLAWLRTDGSVPGVDHAFPQFSLLIDLLEPMWHVLGTSFLGIWVARGGMWVVSLAVLLAVGWWARRALGPEVALATLVTLSALTDFNERVIEIRSDGVLVLLWVLAFGLLARDTSRGTGLRACLLAGALAALAFAFNFKSLTVLPFLGLAALLPVRGEPWEMRAALRRAFALAVGVAAGLVLYLLYLVARGDLALFVETITRNLTVSGDARIRMEPWSYVFSSEIRNVPFYLLMPLGLGILLWSSRELSRLQWLPPLLFSVVYFGLNPTFFPYNFVDVGPFWALAAGAGFAWLLGRLPTFWGALAPLALLLVALWRLSSLLVPTIEDQLTINRFAMSVTSPQDRVYDTTGLILFRRGPYHWRLHSLMLYRYYDGAFAMWRELEKQPWRLMLPSYRTDWLTREDKLVLRNFYPFPHPNVGVLGWVFPPQELLRAEDVRFPILLPGRYRLLTERVPDGAFLLDGRPVRGPVHLEAGEHRLKLSGGPSVEEPRVALVWAPDGMEEALAKLPDRGLRLFYPFSY